MSGMRVLVRIAGARQREAILFIRFLKFLEKSMGKNAENCNKEMKG